MGGTLPAVVEVDAWGITTEVTMPMTHLCPFKAETDHGSITLSWWVDYRTLELHSLREYLDAYADVKVSHETLTRDVYSELAELEITDLSVKTEWTTAGGTVKVSVG